MNYAVPFLGASETQILHTEQTPATFTIAQMIDTFLSHKDLKPSSEQSYRSSFAQFMEFIRLNSITVVTEKDIKNYKEHLISKKLSQFTIISHLSSVKSLFSFLA